MDELIWLRTHSRGKTFYEAMTQSAGQDGLLADKIKRFTAKLDTWSKKANLYSVDELIGAIPVSYTHLFYILFLLTILL